MSIQKEFDDLVVYWTKIVSGFGNISHETLHALYNYALRRYKSRAEECAGIIVRWVRVSALVQIINGYAIENLHPAYIGDTYTHYETAKIIPCGRTNRPYIPESIYFARSDESLVIPDIDRTQNTIVNMACMNAICITRGLFPTICTRCKWGQCIGSDAIACSRKALDQMYEWFVKETARWCSDNRGDMAADNHNAFLHFQHHMLSSDMYYLNNTKGLPPATHREHINLLWNTNPSTRVGAVVAYNVVWDRYLKTLLQEGLFCV